MPITYGGGDVVPSNYHTHINTYSRVVGGGGLDLCTEMKETVSDSQRFRVRVSSPMKLYLRFQDTDSEMSDRVRKRIPHRRKRNRKSPAPRIITDLIETLSTPS